jgi:hypothetical protein
MALGNQCTSVITIFLAGKFHKKNGLLKVSYLELPAEQFFCDDALLLLCWREMVLDLCPSVKSRGLLKYTRRPMRHNR